MSVGIATAGASPQDRPLVTYVLYAYNEQRYIGEAVESALAQTYSPLEVVLSDDGSVDGTFDTMQAMAAAYTGPHKVILNRNATNKGIGSQLNAAYRKSGGELIVLANGDDISRPDRVEVIVRAWLAGGRKASAICADMKVIGPTGNDTGEIFPMRGDYSDLAAATYRRFGGVGAASLAVARACFDEFGPLSEALILEDGPLNLRASLTGEWIFISDPLVSYRVHEENISQSYLPAPFDVWLERHQAAARWQAREGQKAFAQMIADLYAYTGAAHDPVAVQRSRVNATRRLLEQQLLSSYHTDAWPHTLGQWWGIALQLWIAVVKISVKRIFPFIERRNHRWQYRSVKNSRFAALSAHDTEADIKAKRP